MRAGLLTLLMALSVIFAAAWTPTHFLADDKPPVSLERMFPAHFRDWVVDNSVVPVPPSPDLQKVIDETYDQTLARTYRNSQGQRIMLSIAYGRNQHAGMNTHRPEVCYPAQGFQIVQEGATGQLPFHSVKIPVTRLVAAAGERNEPITYWVIVGDKITGFGRPHKMSTLLYGLSGKIPDGMLLRFSSVQRDDAAGFSLQESFVRDLLESMSESDRYTVLGKIARTS